jgi:NADH dehydrogenase
MTAISSPSQRIVIIGAGFAGMWSALGAMRVLDQQCRNDVEVVLVAPQPELHLRPRLYEGAPAEMRAGLTELFNVVGVRFVQGFVERVDVVNHRLELRTTTGPSTLTYDRLVLASGSTLIRPGIQGFEHAFCVDQIEDASKLDAHITGLRSRPDSAARRTLVVVGGGFTGIETAAEMPARLRAVFGADADVRVIVVERSDDIGPDLGAGPRPVIEQALRELGVELILGNSVASIDAGGLVTSKGERIEASTVVWTAGMRASELTAQIPGERDSAGRLHVDANLRVKGVADVYATGDTAHAATDDAGHVAMMSCQHALNLGRSSGYNVAADLLGLELLPYSQVRYVTCLDLGPWGAVYTEGWDRTVKMSGAEAKALKTKINTIWIYPPQANRAEALEAAGPLLRVAAIA